MDIFIAYFRFGKQSGIQLPAGWCLGHAVDMISKKIPLNECEQTAYDLAIAGF